MNEETKMKLMKVFDCQDMPYDMRKTFFDNWDIFGNDCYVSYTVGDSPAEETPEFESWLKKNGAIDLEEVLIKHWW